MAQKTEIQYVNRFYVFGSEAPQPEPEKTQKQKKAKLPQLHLEKIHKVYVDPIALCGVVASVVMLCLLIVGAIDLRNTRDAYDQMKEQLTQLKLENAQLSHSYHTGYDIEEIQSDAESMGMIAAEEADGFTVFFSVPEETGEKTLWDNITWFFSWLFSDSEDYVTATWDADAGE